MRYSFFLVLSFVAVAVQAADQSTAAAKRCSPPRHGTLHPIPPSTLRYWETAIRSWPWAVDRRSCSSMSTRMTFG
jgi:hypothetical protein